MSELKVNPEALRNGVSNRAKQTRSNLEDAYDILSNITVPSDFSSSGKAKFTRAKDQIEEADTDIEEFKEAINTIADNFDETENKNETIANNIVSSATYYETQLQTEQIQAEATAQVVGTVVASATNLVFGLAKGIVEVGERIVDTAATVAAVVITQYTLAYDTINGVLTGDYSYSATSQLWKSTMSFVATDFVGNMYNSFYSDTALGQWLNENAATACTSDGVVTGLAEGLGNVIGIAIIAVITGGIGMGVTGAQFGLHSGVSTIISAIAGARTGIRDEVAVFRE